MELPINKIINGDCLEVLKTLPDESVDAIITDPPAGIEFMGKEWDSFRNNKRSKGWATQGKSGGNDFGGFGKVLRPAFCSQTLQDRINFVEFMTEIMTECNRILKSGGHCIVWGLPRTSHWTAFAIENGGLEVRDVIHHIFQTGFPKSLNIGKKISKSRGDKIIRGKIKYKDGWSGFGTALKPACEHWILARKKLSEKTILEQVLKNGGGGLDIDGCRIPLKDNDKTSGGYGNMDIGIGKPMEHQTYRKPRSKESVFEKSGFKSERNFTAKANISGRFPANVIVQDDALDDGIITKTSGGDIIQNTKGYFNNGLDYHIHRPIDEGSKSRYFDIDLWAEKNGILNIPKPNKKEKNLGLEESELPKLMSKESRTGKDCVTPSQGKDRFATQPKKNYHPTCKSVALMSWLIRLISKENDIILDPFIGSGTTAIACLKLNRKFIGIEKELDYIQIANSRIKPYLSQTKL